MIPSPTDLTAPTAGVVILPREMNWQEPRRRQLDLVDAYQPCGVYEIVLREAIRFDELRAWLDAATLHRIWPDLYLTARRLAGVGPVLHMARGSARATSHEHAPGALLGEGPAGRSGIEDADAMGRKPTGANTRLAGELRTGHRRHPSCGTVRGEATGAVSQPPTHM